MRSRIAGGARLDLADRPRHLGEVAGEVPRDAVGLDRPLERAHHVQHRAERVQVRAPVDALVGDELGGHERDGADEPTGHGELGAVRVVGLDHPEVGDLRLTFAGQQDVGRLEVAVDEPGLVDVRQPLQDPPQDAQDAVEPIGWIPLLPGRDLGVQIVTFDQLERDPRVPLVDAGLEHVDHVRVVDPRQRAELPREPLDVLGEDPRRVEDLDGDGGPPARVVGHVDRPVHGGHAAAAEDRLEVVVPERVTGDRMPPQPTAPPWIHRELSRPLRAS
jgi:hypothetical protein